MKVVLTEFVTLDGVSQGPGSPDEDTSGGFTRGGWLVPHLDVVTSTLTEGSRHPATVLRGDPVRTVGELKARPGGSRRSTAAHGSATRC